MTLVRAPDQHAPGRAGGPVTSSCCGSSCCCCCVGSTVAAAVGIPLAVALASKPQVDRRPRRMLGITIAALALPVGIPLGIVLTMLVIDYEPVARMATALLGWLPLGWYAIMFVPPLMLAMVGGRLAGALGVAITATIVAATGFFTDLVGAISVGIGAYSGSDSAWLYWPLTMAIGGVFGAVLVLLGVLGARIGRTRQSAGTS